MCLFGPMCLYGQWAYMICFHTWPHANVMQLSYVMELLVEMAIGSVRIPELCGHSADCGEIMDRTIHVWFMGGLGEGLWVP